MYRGPPVTQDEWEEKKVLFDEQTGRILPKRAQISARAWGTREYVLKQFWASYVKDEFDLIIAIQTKADFSCAKAVMDKIGGWEQGD